jgi:hypothetical protein
LKTVVVSQDWGEIAPESQSGDALGHCMHGRHSPNVRINLALDCVNHGII